MQTRSDFIASGTVALLAPAAGKTPAPLASPSPSPSPEPSLPPLHFDVPAFNAILDVAAPHRHLFGATKLDGGLVFGQMRGTLNAYRDIGVSLRDVRPVAVLYHGLSVTLGFDDTVWNEYFIPVLAPQGKKNGDEEAKDFNSIYDAKKRGNPCLHKQGGNDDTSIESLVADAGARFFVCNNATKGFARYIARHLHKPPVAVYNDLTAHLVPNCALVPAGVWAMHAIQERRYTLLQSTL